MSLDSICRSLARTTRLTLLERKIISMLCKLVLRGRDGLYHPSLGLIVVGERHYIWEANTATLSHAYMTRVSKRKLRDRESAGAMKSNIEEDQQTSSLMKSIKAKLLMILLILLLLLTSLTEEFLLRKLKEIGPVLDFNLKTASIPRATQTKTDSLDGSQLTLPKQ